MYKLHLLQHPDWHRTGTSYCYFYIFEIIHHDIVIFSKTYPSFFTIKEGVFRIPPSPFSQRELHILTKPSLLRKEGCNRPTRCSEPLRSKVGGPSKVYAMVVRDGTAWRKNQVLRTASHQWKITLFII